jgi:hypothetical protein
MLRTIALSTLICITASTSEGDKPQPPEVLNALAPLEKSVVANYKTYQAANAKEIDKAILVLETAFKKAMLKEDLEGGTLIKKAIEGLRNGDTVTAIEANYKKQLDLLGTNVDLKKEVIGKWRMFNGVVTIDGNMKAMHSNGGIGNVSFANNKATITWIQNGWKLADMSYDEKTKTLSGKHLRGDGSFDRDISITKIQ